MTGEAPAGLSPRPLEFTVQWLPGDVRRYLLARLYRPRVLLPFGLLAAGGLAVLVGLNLRTGGGPAGMLPAIVLLLALPLVLLGLIPLLVDHHVRRAFRHEELGAPSSWQVGPAGIRLRQGTVASSIDWSEIDSARESRDGFGLSWQGGLLLVPKRCLTDEETVRELRNWLRTALAPGRFAGPG